MKKLLLLAMLALGLCASPAFAGTIDFTKVDDAFLYELNNSYRTDDWYYRWERLLDYKLPGSEAGIRFSFDAWEMEGPWGWDNSGNFYRNADGIALDFEKYTWVRMRFYSDLAQEVAGWSVEDFFITLRTEFLELSVDFDFIRSDGTNAYMSYGNPYASNNQAWDFYTSTDAKGLSTINVSDICASGWNGLSSDSLIESIFIGVPYSWDSAFDRLTLSSISHPSITSSAVPVPAAVWLLGTGVAGVAALRRKFK